MEDLTKVNTTDLKKQIFELCDFIFPKDLLIEADTKLHIFHAIKISNIGSEYSIKDVSKEKPTELNNKFLLVKIREELESLVKSVQAEVIEEAAIEAMGEFEKEPNPIELENIERELRDSKIFEEEEIPLIQFYSGTK
jgi:hypothetical protein